MVDSGLIVVVSIIFSMIVCVLVVLTYVKYEWCEVLFSNFTVSQQEVCYMLHLSYLYKNEKNRRECRVCLGSDTLQAVLNTSLRPLNKMIYNHLISQQGYHTTHKKNNTFM